MKAEERRNRGSVFSPERLLFSLDLLYKCVYRKAKNGIELFRNCYNYKLFVKQFLQYCIPVEKRFLNVIYFFIHVVL